MCKKLLLKTARVYITHQYKYILYRKPDLQSTFSSRCAKGVSFQTMPKKKKVQFFNNNGINVKSDNFKQISVSSQ